MSGLKKTIHKFYVEWKSPSGWWRTTSEFASIGIARRDAKENYRCNRNGRKARQRIVEQITKIHKV